MNQRLKVGVVTLSTLLLAMVVLGGVLGRTEAAEDAYPHFAVLTEVVSRIKSDYVEEPEMKNVTLGALTGMLEALDPFASYLNADQYKHYQRSKSRPQASVGLILARRAGYVGVVNAIPGSPAHKAGLATGDILEAISGISTRDMPLAYAEILLEGEAGTSVELTVLRVRRGAEGQKISLVRAPMRFPELSSRMLDGQVGYLKVPSLEGNKAQQAASLLKKLESEGAAKLILDLRDNATGNPEQGIALANLFVGKGSLGYLEGQKYSRELFEAKAAEAVSNLPMVVLINRGTAGAAEITAAALLENKRAELVGERTYGSAAVRKALTLDDGSAVILSVAKYYSPSGKSIQDQAVTPTVPVIDTASDTEISEEAQEPQPAAQPSEDIQLKKALEVLDKGASQVVRNSASSQQDSGPGSLTPLKTPRPPQ